EEAVVGFAPEGEDHGVGFQHGLDSGEGVLGAHAAGQHLDCPGHRLHVHALGEEALVDVGAYALVDVLAHHEVAGDDRDLAAFAGEEVGGGGSGEVAVLVHHHAARTRPDLAGEDVGGGGDVGQAHAGDLRHAGDGA